MKVVQTTTRTKTSSWAWSETCHFSFIDQNWDCFTIHTTGNTLLIGRDSGVWYTKRAWRIALFPISERLTIFSHCRATRHLRSSLHSSRPIRCCHSHHLLHSIQDVSFRWISRDRNRSGRDPIEVRSTIVRRALSLTQSQTGRPKPRRLRNVSIALAQIWLLANPHSLLLHTPAVNQLSITVSTIIVLSRITGVRVPTRKWQQTRGRILVKLKTICSLHDFHQLTQV